ncbi:MAG TPA: PAS domain S-box protein [Thermotogota bacterium]|nr:PAS domain S-box protein [Thermotogota bacterium]
MKGYMRITDRQAFIRRTRQTAVWMVCLCLISTGVAAEVGVRRVLVLQSYYQGYPQADAIQRGITDILGSRDGIELSVEYLDAFHHSDDRYISHLTDLYYHKFTEPGSKVDLVIAVDYQAHTFCLEGRAKLFPDAFVVFCGLDESGLKTPTDPTYMTGIFRTYSLKETVDIGLSFKPEAENLAVVSGSSPADQALYASVKDHLAKYRGVLNLIELVQFEAQALKEFLIGQQENTIVLYLSYSQDPTGKAFLPPEGARLATVNPRLLVLALNEEDISNGIVGGKVNQGYAQGAEAARVALRVLEEPDKTKFSEISRVENRYVFDSVILRKLGIRKEKIPDEALLLNSNFEQLITQREGSGGQSFFSYEIFEEHSMVMVLSEPETGIIIEANRKARDFYGYPDLVGQSWADILYVESEERASPAGVEDFNPDMDRQIHRISDGSLRNLLVYSSEVKIGDTPVLFSILSDITDQVYAEETIFVQEKRLRNMTIHTAVLMVSVIVVLIYLLYSRKRSFQALQSSEQKYRQIAENAPATVFQFQMSREGRYSFPYISTVASEMTGIPPEKITENAASIMQIIYPEDVPEFMTKIRESAESLSYFFHAFRCNTLKGTIWIEARATPNRLKDGTTQWNGFLVDITERIISEKRIQESNNRLITVMNSIDAIVYIADMETYELLFVNEDLLKAWGRDIIGQTCWKTIQSGMDGPCPFCTNHLLLDAAGNPKEVYQWEIQNSTNGKWYDCRDRAIRWIDGRMVRMEIATDITERKEAERALFESENKFRTLFSSMSEMVALHELVFDAHGKFVDYRITDCNEAYTFLTGMEKEQMVGKLGSEVYRSDPPPFLDDYAEVALTGKPNHIETFFPLFNRYLSVSIVSPEKNKFATVATDISEIKRAEKTIEEKNKELEQIIYVASHDLRSPLVNVDGYSRELEYTVDDFQKVLETGAHGSERVETIVRSAMPDINEALKHIRTSARQMDALLKGLLRLSRSGRAALNIVALDMDALLRAVLSSLDYQITTSGVQIRLSPLPSCLGDEIQITQVFSNLIGNALKFLDGRRQGVITITGAVEKGCSVYCVEDNGIGIAPEHQENIFQLFHRLNPQKTEGEGLGLTIVKQIVVRNGGKVWVRSEINQGSQFYVSLPMNPHKN